MKILLLGHGRRYGNDFRCSPLATGALQSLIAAPNEVVMVDDCPEVDPDFVFDLKETGWIGHVGTGFDLVVETVSFLACDVKSSPNFWAGVNAALTKGVGRYVGWHDAGGYRSCNESSARNHMVVRLTQSEVNEELLAHPKFGRRGSEVMLKYVIGDRLNRPVNV